MASEEVSKVVVLAAMLESELGWVVDPNFIASLATLVTALTGLIVAVRAQGAVTRTQEHVVSTAAAVDRNSATLADVKEQTNGGMADLRAEVAALKAQVAAAGLTPWRPAQAPHAGTPGAADTKSSSAGQ